MNHNYRASSARRHATHRRILILRKHTVWPKTRRTQQFFAKENHFSRTLNIFEIFGFPRFLRETCGNRYNGLQIVSSSTVFIPDRPLVRSDRAIVRPYKFGFQRWAQNKNNHKTWKPINFSFRTESKITKDLARGIKSILTVAMISIKFHT